MRRAIPEALSTAQLHSTDEKEATRCGTPAEEIERARYALHHHFEVLGDDLQELWLATSESLNETVKEIKEDWSLSSAVGRHPWTAVGIAAAGGALLGRLIRPKRPVANTSESPGHNRTLSPQQSPGLLGELFQGALSDLKGMAVLAALDGLRQLSRKGKQEETPEPTPEAKDPQNGGCYRQFSVDSQNVIRPH